MPDQDLPRSVPVPPDAGTFPTEVEPTTAQTSWTEWTEWTEVVVIEREIASPIPLILAVTIVGSAGLLAFRWFRRRGLPANQGKNKAT